jgi:hypothetical protein
VPTNLVVNGVSFAYPIVGDQQWGSAATNWAIAVTSGMLQKAGGAFTLTSEVDFGSTYGVKVAYLKTETTNVADAGWGRLAKTDVINWRNNANGANLSLGINGSDQLTFNGSSFLTNPMTTLGDLLYGGASGVPTRLAGDTSNTRKFLREVSSGAVAAAPAWDTLVAGDIPNLSAAIITSGTLATARGGTNGDSSASTGIAHVAAGVWSYSTIVNADVNAAAAIAYSKLNLSASIVNADVSGSAAIAYSKLSLSASIVNADVSTSAAIALSKLAGLTVQSKATTYAILITDDVLLADTSGGAWSATLPAANGQIKVIRVKKTTADFSALTIARAGADTISDLSTGLTSTTLNTIGEEVYLVNDGSSIWHVLERRIPSVWTAYTPTGAWSANTTYTGMYKRIGDSVKLRIKVACSGAPTSASLSVNIFSGGLSTLTIDTTKMPSTSTVQYMGYGTVSDSDVTAYQGPIFYSTTTAVLVKYDNGSGVAQVTQAAPFTFGSGDYLTFEVLVPVTGWNA